MRHRIAAIVAAALVISIGATSPIAPAPTAAAPPVEAFERPAGAGAGGSFVPAQRISGAVDVVTIYNRTNALNPVVQDRATAAAADVGAAWALGRGATVGMRSLRRGDANVKVASAPFQYPMGLTVLPPDAVGRIMGTDVAAVLGGGQVVMGASSAALNSAQAGDVVDLVADDGSTKSFRIGLVAADAVVGGAELVVTPSIADQLGVVIVTRIVMWGFSSRGAIDAALGAQGLTARVDTRIRRSWDPVDPDSQLGIVATKQLLGEFTYSVSANDTVTQSAAWIDAYLPATREVLLAQIPIRARCNVAITADLTAALQEVYDKGLAGAIDVANANTYGGCHYARFNRLSVALGTLSRHSWGGALDTNTTTNAQGAVPKMNCDVVRIFRKHNFAWGGNFLTPDGMHFEWVGTRRDQYQYPSAYCPNLPTAAGTASGPESATEPTTELVPSMAVPGALDAGVTGRSTLFAEDGWGGA